MGGADRRRRGPAKTGKTSLLTDQRCFDITHTPAMLLDLSEIVMRTGMRSAVEVDQETLEDPDLRLAEPLVGRVQFQNSGDLLNISGRLKTVLEIPCARCLADVRVPASLAVDEHFPLDDVTHPTAPPDEGEEFGNF